MLPLASDHTRSGKLAAERPCVHLSLNECVKLFLLSKVHLHKYNFEYFVLRVDTCTLLEAINPLILEVNIVGFTLAVGLVTGYFIY